MNNLKFLEHSFSFQRQATLMRAKMDRMILSASKNRLQILLFHRERR